MSSLLKPGLTFFILLSSCASQNTTKGITPNEWRDDLLYLARALDMRNEANAILVGSPTGMRPNHYGEHAEFRLPNSGFRVSYSTHYHRRTQRPKQRRVFGNWQVDPLGVLGQKD